jgi:hypothetical protein
MACRSFWKQYVEQGVLRAGATADQCVEPFHNPAKRLGLRTQFFGRGSALLGGSRSGLCYLPHLGDSFGDLLNSPSLLLAPQVNLIDESLHFCEMLCNGRDGGSHAIHFGLALVSLYDGFLYQGRSVPRGVGAAVSQVDLVLKGQGAICPRKLRAV